MTESAASATAATLPASSSGNNKYAFMTLVMGGDEYIPGALALASSFRSTHAVDSKDSKIASKPDMCCMVTADVSDTAKRQLQQWFDRVLEVDYIRKRAQLRGTTKQDKMYGSWADVACTKWNVLRFDEYARVAFVDADMLFVGDCSSLFETVQPPAATFSSAWWQPFTSGAGATPNHYLDCTDTSSSTNAAATKMAGDAKQQDSNKPRLTSPLHGQEISRRDVQRVLYSNKRIGSVASGALVLLRPSRSDFEQLLRMLDTAPEPYGYETWSGIDEQAIVDFYHRVKRETWHHIHQAYQFIPWKRDWLLKEAYGVDKRPNNNKVQEPDAKKQEQVDLCQPPHSYLLHFFGMKPWRMSRSDFPDLALWFKHDDVVKSTAKQPKRMESREKT